MEFILTNKDNPANVQCYYTDNVIKTESAANLATAGKTYMLRLGNILSDKSFNNSYIYTENGWRVIDISTGGGGGGGTTYTAGDGIEISDDVISALLAENGGLEFVDGKLSVVKAPTTKPFNEDTYNDFVVDESHNVQDSRYDLCFTTLDAEGSVADPDTYLESGKFKIMIDCEEHSYNISSVLIPIRDVDGNVSDITFDESGCTVKSVTVEFTDEEKHIYIEKYTGEIEDYSDAIENATGVYEAFIYLSNEYGLSEVAYTHEVTEDGIIKLSGASTKQLEAGIGIEIVDGKIQSIPYYRGDEYLGSPQPYIASSYGDLISMGNDFKLYDGVICFNNGVLSNPIRINDGILLNIFDINEGVFASNYTIKANVSFLVGDALEDVAELMLNCTDEVANIEVGYDERDNEFYLMMSDSDFNELDTDFYGFDNAPITGSPYLVLDVNIETDDGFDDELCDMDALNSGLTYYVPINKDNTFFQLTNSEGVAYDYKRGTFSFSGGGGGRNLMPASGFDIDVQHKFNDSKAQDEASIELHGEGLPDGTWAGDRVAQWNYVISIDIADIFYVSFNNGQNTIAAFEDVKLYGETTFFMKKDEYGFCQYGLTTQDESDPYKKNTYINNALPAESYEVPSDLFIYYDGEGYGLTYASFERGEAYIDYN